MTSNKMAALVALTVVAIVIISIINIRGRRVSERNVINAIIDISNNVNINNNVNYLDKSELFELIAFTKGGSVLVDDFLFLSANKYKNLLTTDKIDYSTSNYLNVVFLSDSNELLNANSQSKATKIIVFSSETIFWYVKTGPNKGFFKIRRR